GSGGGRPKRACCLTLVAPAVGSARSRGGKAARRIRGSRSKGAAGAAAPRPVDDRLRLPCVLSSQGGRGRAARGPQETVQRSPLQRDGRARRVYRRLQQDRADSRRDARRIAAGAEDLRMGAGGQGAARKGQTRKNAN